MWRKGIRWAFPTNYPQHTIACYACEKKKRNNKILLSMFMSIQLIDFLTTAVARQIPHNSYGLE